MNSGSLLIYIRVGGGGGGVTVARSLVRGGQCSVHDQDKTWTVAEHHKRGGEEERREKQGSEGENGLLNWKLHSKMLCIHLGKR